MRMSFGSEFERNKVLLSKTVSLNSKMTLDNQIHYEIRLKSLILKCWKIQQGYARPGKQINSLHWKMWEEIITYNVGWNDQLKSLS